MQFDFFERHLARFFYHYAKFVSRHTLGFLVCPLLLTVVLLLGCVWFLETIPDNIDLYTPNDGAARKEETVLDQLFPINQSSDFFVERRYGAERLGYIIVTAKEGDNMLTPLLLNETIQLWQRIETLHVWDHGAWLSLDKLCIPFPRSATCVQNPLLAAYKSNSKLLDYLKYPFTDDGVYTGALLGGVEFDTTSQVINSAKAILIPYQLRHATEQDDRRGEEWELELDDFLTRYQSQFIVPHWWTSETLPTEARRDTQTLIRLLGPLFLLVSVFTIACCMVGSWVRSKPWLGVGGVVSASCAIISAIGFLAYVGQPFTSIAYFVPFIVFSIGVDNLFVLLAAWQKTSINLDVEERMGRTFREAGVSITVTTLTDAMSFGIGCLTSFMSVKIFCTYATVAIFFVYAYQLTLVAAVMVLTGMREKAGRHCFTFRRVKFRTAIKALPPPDSSTGSRGASHDGTYSSHEYEPPVVIKDHMMARFFQNYYTPVITHPIVQAIVIVIFFIYIGFAIWGFAGITVGLEPTDLLPTNSPAQETLQLHEKYFSLYSQTELHVIFTNLSTSLDYESPFWYTIERELERFENTRYTGYADSWLRIFLAFTKTSKLELRPDNFIPLLQHLLLKRSAYEKYGHDIVFNELGTRIEATRFPVRMRNVGFANHTDAMRELRVIATESPLFNVTVFNPFFRFADQYSSILRNTVFNVGVASGIVILVSLALIPKPLCSIWVSLTIISINVGILGYMSFWGVKLDFVSMVTIMMSIGLCVDFSAHIAYHFAKGLDKDPVARIRQALYSVGTPIVQSAISTMIGVLLLVMVENYVYRSFLKTIMLVIWLGTLHGLVILPVLLTLFYCGNCCESNGSSTDSMADAKKVSQNGTMQVSTVNGMANGLTDKPHSHNTVVPSSNHYHSSSIAPYPVPLCQNGQAFAGAQPQYMSNMSSVNGSNHAAVNGAEGGLGGFLWAKASAGPTYYAEPYIQTYHSKGTVSHRPNDRRRPSADTQTKHNKHGNTGSVANRKRSAEAKAGIRTDHQTIGTPTDYHGNVLELL